MLQSYQIYLDNHDSRFQGKINFFNGILQLKDEPFL